MLQFSWNRRNVPADSSSLTKMARSKLVASESLMRADGPKALRLLYELDDGWPESVEEQGLLLLVHITKQYIKDVL